MTSRLCDPCQSSAPTPNPPFNPPEPMPSTMRSTCSTYLDRRYCNVTARTYGSSSDGGSHPLLVNAGMPPMRGMTDMADLVDVAALLPPPLPVDVPSVEPVRARVPCGESARCSVALVVRGVVDAPPVSAATAAPADPAAPAEPAAPFTVVGSPSGRDWYHRSLRTTESWMASAVTVSASADLLI